MTYQPGALPAEALEFLRERHLATLTTLRSDGSPHVVPVGFTWDAPTGTARVITRGGSAKTRHAAADPRVAISQVDGGRWITVEGRARVTDDPDEVADAVARYAVRYRQPGVNPERVAIVVTVERVLASAAFGKDSP